MIHNNSSSISNNNLGDEIFPSFSVSKPTSSTTSTTMDASSKNPSAAPSGASTPATLSAPSATGERRKSSAYDSAPSQGYWEADKEKEHQGFLKKLTSNKLAPSFLK